MEKGLRKLNELGLGTARRVVDLGGGWVGSSSAGVRNEAMGRGESGRGGRTAAKPGPLSRFLVPLAAAAVAGATGLRLPPPDWKYQGGGLETYRTNNLGGGRGQAFGNLPLGLGQCRAIGDLGGGWGSPSEVFQGGWKKIILLTIWGGD